jgi:hypothetical protein
MHLTNEGTACTDEFFPFSVLSVVAEFDCSAALDRKSMYRERCGHSHQMWMPESDIYARNIHGKKVANFNLHAPR